MLTVEVDTSRLMAKVAAAQKDLDGDLRRATWVALDTGHDVARAAVPVKSGALRSKIRKRMISGGRGEIRVSSPYARAIDQGGLARVIHAKNGGLLRFRGSGGGWVSKRSVNHPATKAQPFMAPARDEMRTNLRTNAEQAARHFASRFRSR